jgi:hypothetical protein
MAASRTARRAFDELAMTSFTLPADPLPGFPPYAFCNGHVGLDFGITASLGVARIAIRPLVELRRLSRALGTAHVVALVADGGRGREEEGVAFVAGPPHALLGRLVDPLLAVPRLDGQELLPLLRRLALALVPGLALLDRRLLLGIAGALFAALVLAVGAGLVGAKRRAAVVAVSVDTHPDGLLNALHADGLRGGRNPLVRLQGQSILGEQGARAFLLEGAAVEFLRDGDSGDGDGGDGRDGCGRGGRSSGGATSRSACILYIFTSQCSTHAGVAFASFPSSSAVAGGAAAAEVPLLLGFSRLKTLLMRLTYFPRLLRRSTSLLSDGGAPPDGVDILAGIGLLVSVWQWNDDGRRTTKRGPTGGGNSYVCMSVCTAGDGRHEEIPAGWMRAEPRLDRATRHTHSTHSPTLRRPARHSLRCWPADSDYAILHKMQLKLSYAGGDPWTGPAGKKDGKRAAQTLSLSHTDSLSKDWELERELELELELGGLAPEGREQKKRRTRWIRVCERPSAQISRRLRSAGSILTFPHWGAPSLHRCIAASPHSVCTHPVPPSTRSPQRQYHTTINTSPWFTRQFCAHPPAGSLCCVPALRLLQPAIARRIAHGRPPPLHINLIYRCNTCTQPNHVQHQHQHPRLPSLGRVAPTCTTVNLSCLSCLSNGHDLTSASPSDPTLSDLCIISCHNTDAPRSRFHRCSDRVLGAIIHPTARTESSPSPHPDENPLY